MLEFNAPAHGCWNIVHTGMLLPEARQIYVCAQNCMRGVVLTAAEMGMADRFSYVILNERDLYAGNLEEITIEGVTDVLNRLDKKPRAVLLFTVCVHHFVGCDLRKIYRELGERFPEIDFIRCYMDPIMKKRLSPDQKLRRAIYDSVRLTPEEKHTVTLLGSDFALDQSSDLKRMLSQNGLTLRELPGCKTWKDYQQLGEGKLFLCCYPQGKYGAEAQAERFGRKLLYLPTGFDYDEIEEQLKTLSEELGFPIEEGKDGERIVGSLSIEKEKAECEAALLKAKEHIGDTPVVLDYTLHPRPLGLAKLLLEHGFCVTTVYLDSVSPEEVKVKAWIDEYAPEVIIKPTIAPCMRFTARTSDGKVLALGQKAAWFTGSPYFVNMVQGGGLYGFDGIRKMAKLMEEAFEKEKDTEDLIVRKGWGCVSCI